MQLLYNSDSFTVLRFDVPAAAPAGDAAAAQARGGYEIVDKFARKGIFIEGDVAQSFQNGVQALIEAGPSEEALDEYIGNFTQLAQQPVVLH